MLCFPTSCSVMLCFPTSCSRLHFCFQSKDSPFPLNPKSPTKKISISVFLNLDSPRTSRRRTFEIAESVPDRRGIPPKEPPSRGGGGSGEEDDYNKNEEEEDEEFGPVMQFEEAIRETEARGAIIPSDMLEAAKSIGIRRLLLIRYIDL